MADISKITLPSGITYNLKDAEAREALDPLTNAEVDEMLADEDEVLIQFYGIHNTGEFDENNYPITTSGQISLATAKKNDFIKVPTVEVAAHQKVN